MISSTVAGPAAAAATTGCARPAIPRIHPIPPDSDDTPARGFFRVTLRRVVEIRDVEVAATLWSAAYLFFVLCSYYVLRPLRDEISTADPENLQNLWTATFFVMLAAVPAYGWMASRSSRRVFIPIVYRFFMVNLLLFAAALWLLPASAHLAVERVFYVWLSVYSLFVVTVFWGFMADVFRNEQGRRLFGFITFGGSIGAVAGSALTGGFVSGIGMPALMLVAVVLLEAGVRCMRRVHRLHARPRTTTDGSIETSSALSDPAVMTADAPVTGSVWRGMLVVFQSPYLLGICLYLFLHTFSASFLYYHQAYILGDAIADRDERREVLAYVDLVVNCLAAFGQCFLTGRVVRWIGVGRTLMILPAVSFVGFAALGAALLAWTAAPDSAHAAPMAAGYSLLVWVLVLTQVTRRSANFTFAKPAREILFTVVPRDQKYESKAFVDTAVYRGGDLISAYLFAGLKWTGLGLASLALLAVPVAAAWAVVGHRLGRRQDQMADEESRPCPWCGYELRGSPGACPECGRAVTGGGPP